MIKRLPITLLTFLVLSSSVAFGQGADPLPTMPELLQLQTEKQWQPLLQKLSRVLSLRGDAAKNYDRYELLTMKGEAHAQLKQVQPAASAFTDAAKEAAAQKDRAAVASSTALLFKRANQFVYKRKSPTTQPTDTKEFDVLDPAKRKDAFAALAADELAVLKPKVKNATSANNLRPVIELMKSMEDLRNAELASAGNTAMSDSLLPPLAAHSKDLSAKYVAEQKIKVENIEKTANQVIDTGPDRRGAYGGRTYERKYKKRGLMPADSTALKNIISDSEQFVRNEREMAGAFGQDLGKPLLEVADNAAAVATKAKAVLDADYSITTSDPKGLK